MVTSLWFILSTCMVSGCYVYIKQSLPAISSQRQKLLQQFSAFAKANTAQQLNTSDLEDFWQHTNDIKSNFTSNEDRQLRNALNDNALILLKINEALADSQSDSQLKADLNNSRKKLVTWFDSTNFNLNQILLAEANHEPDYSDVLRECKRIAKQTMRV